MAGGRRTSVNLRFEDSAGATAALTADFAEDATIAHLLDSLTGFEAPRFEGVDWVRDEILGIEYGLDSVLASVQFVHGQLLTTGRIPEPDDEPSPVEFSPAPTLAKVDRLRLLHEGGPHLGFAWPFGPNGNTLRWSLNLDFSAVRVAPNARADVRFELEDDQLRVAFGSDELFLTVNGRYEKSGVLVPPGASIRLSDGKEDSAGVELRVLTRAEHDQIRSINGNISYRVRPPDVALTEIVPLNETVPAPTPRPKPEWHWLDVLLQQGSTLVIYIFLLGRGGGLYLLPFMFLPVAYALYRRIQFGREVSKVIRANTEALGSFDRELGKLEDAVQQEATIIEGRNPPLETLSLAAELRDRAVWQRRPDRESFLRTVIGRGRYESPSQIKISGQDTDGRLSDWRADAETVRMLDDAPLEFDLKTKNLGLIGPSSDLHSFVADFVLRLAHQHSPAHVALGALLPTDKSEREKFGWLRWLPHTSVVSELFSGPRFLSGPLACRRAIQLSAELLLDIPEASAAHLILLVHEGSGVDAGDLERYQKASMDRVHVLWVGGSSSRLPAAFEQWIELRATAGESSVPQARQLPGGAPITVAAINTELAPDTMAAQLAPLADEGTGIISQSIAQVVPLGAIVSIPDRSSERNWPTPATSLVSVLGEDASGPFMLDLVEHGPHVLIAGTTGSGKSELLRSLVLSLATRYRPRDVAFLLIDFKGGASLGDLEALPHCVGMVSNLEAVDVDRLIRFLNAEIERRQGLLAAYNGEYRRYFKANGSGLPRLVVVIDEFAGFVADGQSKRETAILNLAARGRSLGVHLVIATQSPKGVVTPQVRANVNARISLRVLEESDSEQVLDSSVAKFINRGLQGRAFARWESDRLLQFQTAYTESRTFGNKEVRPVNLTDFDPVSHPIFIADLDEEADHSAERQKASGPEGARLEDASSESDEAPSDAKVLLEALKFLAFGTEGFEPDENWCRPTSKLQPRLEPSLTARKIRDAAGARTTDPLSDEADETAGAESDEGAAAEALSSTPVEPGRLFVGRRDEPERQRQAAAWVDLGQGGLLVSGVAVSGRTHALAAAALDFVNNNEACQLVVVDCGGGDLGALLEGASWTIHGPDRASITHLFQQLEADYGEANAPLLLVMDRIDIVQDVLGDVTGLSRLVAGGARRNIYIAASRDSSLPLDSDLARSFRHALNLLDEYAGIAEEAGGSNSLIQFASPERLTLELAHLLEDSVANGDPSRYPLAREGLPGAWRPLGFPTIAELQVPTTQLLAAGVAIGVDEVRHEAVQVRASEGLAIVGTPGSGKSTTLLAICEALYQRTGKRVPFIGKGLVPQDSRSVWCFDVMREWQTIWETTTEATRPTYDSLAARCFGPELLPVIAIDDFPEMDGFFDFMSAVERGNLKTALKPAIERAKVMPIAVVGLETLMGTHIPWFGAERLTLRGRLINLRPLPPHLLPPRNNLSAAVTNLFSNTNDREYGLGEGVYVDRGRRRELKITPTLAATQLAGEFLTDARGAEW